MSSPPTEKPKKLGELLVERGDITAENLENALKQQSKFQERLGHILTSLNKLHPLQLYQAIATQASLSFVDLQHEPPDANLSDYHELEYYLSHRCIPWRLVKGDMVIACCEPTDKLRHWAQQFYHEKVRFVICTPRDLLAAIDQLFSADIDEDTRTRLLKSSPHLSAHQTLHPKQATSLVGLLVLIAAALLLAPVTSVITLLLLMNGFYLATIGLKAVLYLAARSHPPRAPSLANQDPACLPVYTVLVPLYQEAENITNLLNAIRLLDYPKTRLDVKLVVEADDTTTIDAIKAAQPEPWFEIIRVPYSLPRTKPKACNYALTFAKGDIVTIYDVEDRPATNQLKLAVEAFRQAPDHVICLQARLNYYNRDENWLTRFFAIEYALLFDWMLPGLQALHLPIPLGGTSNHINLKKIREIGEWDPYNVTEDADLGIRLAMMGYRTQILDSLTQEEAPITIRAWIKQRSRWIKGYMQTWLVHMRKPAALYKQLGPRGFWGFQLFIGSPCLVFLTAPFLWVISGIWAAGYTPSASFPAWMLPFCLAVLVIGFICHILLAFVAIRPWKSAPMRFFAVLFPFYWFWHSVASLRALWQLIHHPHLWDKTTHGVSRLQQ